MKMEPIFMFLDCSSIEECFADLGVITFICFK